VDWQMELDPWGNTRKEYNRLKLYQPIRMQGQHLDEASGLFYNRYRYYDPKLGRYISQDPIGLMGGTNVFVYPLNPMHWVDPMGLDPTTAHKPVDIGKASGWWDKITAVKKWKESVAAGKASRINSETLTCKRAAEREKRYEEGRQNKLEDGAAVVRDVFAGELSDAVERGVTDPSGIMEWYGYMTADVPDCQLLLGLSENKVDIEFFKK
jgi:RHS repeat-associated protein